MDRVSPAVRSRNMARIRASNTLLERRVRSVFHQAGLRFRLHDRKLPGVPDIVLPGKQACVFVHGCFWHRCPNCPAGSRKVGSNPDYWERKLDRNVARDAEVTEWLRYGGWRVFVIWECEANGPQLDRLIRRLLAL